VADIKKVYSHPQAIAQCRQYIQTHLRHAEVVETSSTTRAAELTAREPNTGAIASALAAERYGVKILEKDIQDSSTNATRFFVLGRQCPAPTKRDRTSLMVSIAHKVGALHKALAIFSKHKLNMTRIESRPNKRKAWEYFFFVDCDGHYEDRQVGKALGELQKVCTFVKVLGSYPNGE
jgi:chorismate mutase/prephenate dehydratase